MRRRFAMRCCRHLGKTGWERWYQPLVWGLLIAVILLLLNAFQLKAVPTLRLAARTQGNNLAAEMVSVQVAESLQEYGGEFVQVERDEEDDILDNALESLRQMGEGVRGPAKVAFLAAGPEGKEALLDVLADYPGDEDVFRFALEQFKTTRDKRALYAGYLAKLDDDHALEALLDVAEGDDVTYTDFIEIRSAIERLGSEAPVRDWSHDPTYQAFKRLQRAQN